MARLLVALTLIVAASPAQAAARAAPPDAAANAPSAGASASDEATVPDEGWSLPAQMATPPPPPPSTPEVRQPPQVSGVRPKSRRSTDEVQVDAPFRPQTPNTISMFGGRTLGHLTRGQMVFAGFPLLGVKLALGLSDRFDFGVGYQTYFFMMNEVLLGFRVGIVRHPNFALAFVADGSAAFFGTKAPAEDRGARWLTGHRNFNVAPGVELSYQGNHPRSARVFLEARYLLTFDTEPFQRSPLGGVPSHVQLGHNAIVRVGGELPLTAKTSFAFMLGVDVHGRVPDDIPVLPVCNVALVTSL